MTLKAVRLSLRPLTIFNAFSGTSLMGSIMEV